MLTSTARRAEDDEEEDLWEAILVIMDSSWKEGISQKTSQYDGGTIECNRNEEDEAKSSPGNEYANGWNAGEAKRWQSARAMSSRRTNAARAESALLSSSLKNQPIIRPLRAVRNLFARYVV